MRVKIAKNLGWTHGITLGPSAMLLLSDLKGLNLDLTKKDETFWKLHNPCDEWLPRHDKDLCAVMEYCIKNRLDNGVQLDDVLKVFEEHPEAKEFFIPWKGAKIDEGEDYSVADVELPSGRYYFMDCGDYEKLIIPEKINWTEVSV